MTRDGVSFGCMAPHITRAKLSKQQVALLRGIVTKGPQHDMNLYTTVRSNPRNIVTAGLHIHFSNRVEAAYYNTKDGLPFKYYTANQLDIPRIVKYLDKVFSNTIKDAKRQPGNYELKPHGFEYRSLPTNTPLELVQLALDTILKDKH